MNTQKKGFTLIEMLVVIGIIAILGSAMVFGYGRVVKAAGRAKAMELVSNVRTALEELHRNNDGWPQAIYRANKQNGFYVMDEYMAKLFLMHGILNVDGTVKSGGVFPDDFIVRGKERFGIVDPWAQEVIMRKKDATAEGTTVSSGGTVADHRLYFAVDQDDDGFVSKAEGAPGASVRAKAIVWCAGADGGLSDCSTDAKVSMSLNGRTVTNRDNIYSWERAQEDKK